RRRAAPRPPCRTRARAPHRRGRPRSGRRPRSPAAPGPSKTSDRRRSSPYRRRAAWRPALRSSASAGDPRGRPRRDGEGHGVTLDVRGRSHGVELARPVAEEDGDAVERALAARNDDVEVAVPVEVADREIAWRLTDVVVLRGGETSRAVAEVQAHGVAAG